ncbi:GntR family transcriptional regulator [Rhizobium sp. FY34]|uniref:GntR family transcriptional regulator n=1 Tax=Rhizobium sp. FY34 TaxID=2562309 RepID=UPI0010BFA7B6|nr:GntR family transcriptional regulator [Rhizobium sp. FY34]
MSEPKVRSQTASALDKSSVARYLQLASLFRKWIETGTWAVGAQIPTVEMLAKECGVAGMTIRQALDILEKEGLIQRFRAKGTFVRQKPSRDLWCEVQTDWNGLLMSRSNADIFILSDVADQTLDQDSHEVGKVAPAYRQLRRLHKRAGVPFLLADVFVDERLRGLIPEENYSRTTAMRLVADLPGVTITDARQILTIDSADLETATLLDIALSDPIAKVQRLAVDASGTLILVANGLYRGDMVRIDMKLIK